MRPAIAGPAERTTGCWRVHETRPAPLGHKPRAHGNTRTSSTAWMEVSLPHNGRVLRSLAVSGGAAGQLSRWYG